MRRLFPAAVLLSLSLALAACGSRPVAMNAPLGGGPAGTGAPAAPDARATGVPGSDEIAGAIDGVRANAGRERPTPGSRKNEVDYGDDVGAADFNTMPLKVTLSTTCATPGTTMSATAETLPSSKLAFAASYSDNDHVPNFTYVPAEGNPTGTFTWSWEITPATPRGDSLLTVVAMKERKGASYKAPFRVADSC